MPFLDIQPEASIHYQDHNPTGTSPVILLHGLGATCESWVFQVPALTRAGYRVLVPDIRGFGKSKYSGGKIEIRDLASDVQRLTDSLACRPAHVVGISMGGTVALQLALSYKDYVDKLILVNTFAHLKPTGMTAWLYFAVRFILVYTLGLPAQAHAVARRIFPHPEQEGMRAALVSQILEADPRGYRAVMRALARFNVQDRLKEITCPTMIISGKQDSTVPIAVQEQLARGIPGAQQVVISGAGHAVIVDNPDKFNATLLNFLDLNFENKGMIY